LPGDEPEAAVNRKATNKPPRRQHVVPEFYLKRFADSDGRLLMTDKSDGRRISTSGVNPGRAVRCSRASTTSRRHTGRSRRLFKGPHSLRSLGSSTCAYEQPKRESAVLGGAQHEIDLAALTGLSEESRLAVFDRTVPTHELVGRERRAE